MTPRTSAGRLFLDFDADPDLWERQMYVRFGRMFTMTEVVLAIEAEAAAAALSRVRERVEGLPVTLSQSAPWSERDNLGYIRRAAVLAAIDQEAATEAPAVDGLGLTLAIEVNR